MKFAFNPFTGDMDIVGLPGSAISDVPFIVTDSKDNPDVDAADTYGEAMFWEVGDASTYFVITGAYFLPDLGITANDSNYANINVYSRKADGSDPTLLAYITTKITGGSGDWTGFVPVPLTLVDVSGKDIPTGYGLTWTISKSGTGVVLPMGVLVIEGYYSPTTTYVAPTGYKSGYPADGPSEPDVVAQWLMDEPQSASLVDEVSGITLAAGGAPTSVSDLSGLYDPLNPGVSYDGSSYHTSAPAASMAFGTSDGVIEFYATYAGGSNRCVVSDVKNVGSENGWGFQWNSATQVRFAFCADDNTWTSVTKTVPDITGTVVKVRVTVDRSGNCEIFFDGLSQGTGSIATCNGKTLSSWGPAIGSGKSGASSRFNGKIYNVRLTVGNLTNNSGGPGGG